MRMPQDNLSRNFYQKIQQPSSCTKELLPWRNLKSLDRLPPSGLYTSFAVIISRFQRSFLSYAVNN